VAFQSPSLRGSGRFLPAPPPQPSPFPVSIPFIAGQWSLQAVAVVAALAARDGLNPLHCGAVVASDPDLHGVRLSLASQSPSLRGSGRFFDSGGATSNVGSTGVSIPFIAGQWSLPVGAAERI